MCLQVGVYCSSLCLRSLNLLAMVLPNPSRVPVATAAKSAPLAHAGPAAALRLRNAGPAEGHSRIPVAWGMNAHDVAFSTLMGNVSPPGPAYFW